MNMKFSRLSLCCTALFAALALLVLQACKHKPAVSGEPEDGGYPDQVNRIIMTHCTTGPTGGGCHNSIGAGNAAGLRLDTWDALFYGSNHGATVIPYDTINSSLLHYINNDSAWGPVAVPTMPYTGSNFSKTPLSREDYIVIRDWIAAGAPDKNGIIPFSANAASRQKIYISQQGSDYVSVIDADRKVVMRNIKVGVTNNIESPHCIRVSTDGQFLYASFMAGDYLQQFETTNDRFVKQIQLSSGDASWNLFHISDDGKKIIVADFLHGVLKVVNTSDMSIDRTIKTNFPNPHGIASNAAFDTIYITAQFGNTIFKLYPDNNYDMISLDGKPNTFAPLTLDPHEIMMTPSHDKYFVTCEYSNEVRVFDARTDKLIKAIPVPQKPQEIAVSRRMNYMLITCMEADPPNGSTATKGAVVAIDYNTLEVKEPVYGDFWQPHGIAVDDNAGTFYVASTNQSGPSSGHNHSSGGKHGWYNVYDLSKLTPWIQRQYETLILPYSADSRFKPGN